MEGVSKMKGEKRKHESEEDVKQKKVKKERKAKTIVEEGEVQEVDVKEGGIQYRLALSIVSVPCIIQLRQLYAVVCCNLPHFHPNDIKRLHSMFTSAL